MAFIIQGKGVGDAIVFGKAWILPSVSKFEVEYKSISCGKVVHEEIRFRNAVKSLKAELK